MRIAVHGATGRMGKALVEVISSTSSASVVAKAPTAERPIDFSLPLDNEGAVDCVVDFSKASAVIPLARRCETAGVALVSGTTGLSDEQMEQLKQIGKKIPLLWSPNMSVGANICSQLLEQMGAYLGDEWDVEVLEAHHRYKEDAPSGTALQFGHSVCTGRGVKPEEVTDNTRMARREPRKRGTIGYSSIRGGDIVGEHGVTFIADGERITLSHAIYSRERCAEGAVRAARWLCGQKPGFFSFADLL